MNGHRSGDFSEQPSAPSQTLRDRQRVTDSGAPSQAQAQAREQGAEDERREPLR